MKPVVYLIGMPGTGKSAIGPELAERLQVPFIDLDAFIEEQEESPVPELFRRHGESWFRQTEAEALRKLPVAKAGAVVATGGGTPCFGNNMLYMNQAGVTVLLEVPAAELAERLAEKELAKRPLLSGKTKADLLAYLEETWEKRQEFYRQAKLTAGAGEGTSPVENIINALQSRP